MRTRLAIGCMTGTSLDGLDVCAIKSTGYGLNMTVEVVAHVHRDFSSGPLRDGLFAFAHGHPTDARTIVQLRSMLSHEHARVLQSIIGSISASPALVCVHGQTIHHSTRGTWQLIDPSILAAELGVAVISDLRAADMACGGRGAPLSPIADLILYGKHAPCAVCNLGGFCNITLLRDDLPATICAGDVCPCNKLLDGLAAERLGSTFDEGGSHALGGTVYAGLRDRLVMEWTGAGESQSDRALGDDDEVDLGLFAALDSSDALATACDVIARTVSQWLKVHRASGPLVLAGGSVQNAALVRAIQSAVHADQTTRVVASEEWGVSSAAREAAAFGVLGLLSADGIPISLPQVTGCCDPAPIAGTWTLPRGLVSGLEVTSLAEARRERGA